jgi:pullulanase
MRYLNFLLTSCLFISTLFLSACDNNKIANKQTTAQLSTEKFNSEIKNKLKTSKFDFAAHWLTPQILLLPQNNPLHHYSLIKITKNKVISTPLIAVNFPQILKATFPHLANFQAFKLDLSEQKAKTWLKQQLMVITQDRQQQILNRSWVQTANVLDALYTQKNNDADEVSDLGAKLVYESANTKKDKIKEITFKLWAPTAQQLNLLLFNRDKTPANPAVVTMIEDSNTGIWSAQVDKKFNAAFYQYQITLYHPASQKVETLITTDPYSLSLSTNSEYSQVTDLNRASTKPQGWDEQTIPTVKNVEDNILYEVHIRDFSSADPQLANKKSRGKYQAFSEKNSAGIKHLKALKSAGLNTIHLLPTFDIGTINEDPKQTIDSNDKLSKVCKIAPKTSLCSTNYNPEQSLLSLLNSYRTNDNSQQKAQQLVSELRPFDNYNWGYDPFHYTVPEGSYAIDPDGESRLVEFRQMVQSLHNLGFRVIIDVVYNHTHQAGLAKTAVLDKIVPNYYQRLNPITGEIEHSTCCDNTATERVMMAKLMTDSLVVWARDYFIDGFRFDLMGHQPKAAMLKARAAVRKVDPDSYFYGEGWNFGEVANNQRFIQASQLELGGSEIGTYSDRLRDAVRGGAFTASGNALRQDQGLGNGLVVKNNELTSQQNNAITQTRYELLMAQARIGLAGNLANFPLKNTQGKVQLGKDIAYGDQPTGYALDPADTINYVSKHDNQTLWDNNQYRIAYDVSSDDRVRMQLQSLSYVMFAQGIPFIQMGSELLRSKSFLRDSYDYGDWFNRVDFTKQTNYYDNGLPPAEKDQSNWSLIQNLLKQNQGRDHVSAKQIQFSSTIFNEMLKIRSSSPLFRLTSEQAIINQLSFLNTGKEQQQGLIVMKLDNKSSIDKHYQSIIVMFNTSTTTQQFAYPLAANYQLHPVQKNGVDQVVKLSAIKQSKTNKDSFTVPALTTAVFVLPKNKF